MIMFELDADHCFPVCSSWIKYILLADQFVPASTINLFIAF